MSKKNQEEKKMFEYFNLLSIFSYDWAKITELINQNPKTNKKLLNHYVTTYIYECKNWLKLRTKENKKSILFFSLVNSRNFLNVF